MVASAIAVGYLVAMSPRAAVMLAAIPCGLFLVWSAHLRLLTVVFGGLAVLDSSSGFSDAKVLYLAALVVSVLAAWQGLVTTMTHGRAAHIRRLAERGFGIILVLVAASLPVALVHDNSVTVWLRDVAAYLMLGAAPILAADAASQARTKFLTYAFILAGGLVTVSIYLDLASTRNFTSGDTTELALLSSFLLPVTLFAYATARAIAPHERESHGFLWWGLLASGIFAAVMLSGTRAGILMLVIPPAVVIFSGRGRGIYRSIGLGAVAALLVVLAFGVGGSFGVTTRAVQDRLLTTGAALSSPTEDGSLSERFRETGAAWRHFTTSPLVGVGPGVYFEWRGARGDTRRAFVVDSSISTLAKFGVLGVIALLLFGRNVRRIMRMVAKSPERLALSGLAVWLCVYAVLSNPFEDKGFAFGLIFILALLLRSVIDTSAQAGEHRHGALRDHPKDTPKLPQYAAESQRSALAS